jgi:hypothetical protein
MAADETRAVEAVCGVCRGRATCRTPTDRYRCRAHWDEAADRTFGEPIVPGPAASTPAGAAFCRRMIAWALERRREAEYPHERAYWEGQRRWWLLRLEQAGKEGEMWEP